MATDTTDSLPPQTFDEENSEDVDNNLEAGNTEGEESRSSSQEKKKRKKRKVSQNEEDELINILKQKYAQEETKPVEEDPNKLFLLSLLDDLKSLPSHLKLRVKSQIIDVIANAKQSSFHTHLHPPYPSYSGNYYPNPNRRFSTPSTSSFSMASPPATFSSSHSSQFEGIIITLLMNQIHSIHPRRLTQNWIHRRSPFLLATMKTMLSTNYLPIISICIHCQKFDT